MQSTSSGPSLKDVDHIKKQVRNRATSDQAIEVIHLELGMHQGRSMGERSALGKVVSRPSLVGRGVPVRRLNVLIDSLVFCTA